MPPKAVKHYYSEAAGRSGERKWTDARYFTLGLQVVVWHAGPCYREFMSHIFGLDTFKFLGIFLLASFLLSRWVVSGYLATYKQLQSRHGGRVHNRWITYPEFILPQPGGEIIVFATTTSGSRGGESYATAYLPELSARQFSVISKKMPNQSFWKVQDNWTPPDKLDFSSNFAAYSAQPEILDYLLTSEVLAQLDALNQKHAVRICMDVSSFYKDGRALVKRVIKKRRLT